MKEEHKKIFKYMNANDILKDLEKAMDIYQIDQENKTITIKPQNMSDIFQYVSTGAIQSIQNNPFLNWDKSLLEYSFCINERQSSVLLRFYVEGLLNSFEEAFLKEHTFFIKLPEVFNTCMDYLITTSQIFRNGNSEFSVSFNQEKELVVKFLRPAMTNITWTIDIPQMFFDECHK